MRIAGSIQQQAKLMEQRKTVMIKYSQIKTFICIVILTINGIAHAEKPDAMPQSTYDAIINQVIADYSYYNANAVVEGVSQWLLDQPLPVTDGELIQSGDCTNCTATTLSAATGFKQPRKVKVKAKLRANGTFPSVLKIKWNRPKPLDASIINDYEVSHYLIYISKDNQSYEILRKDAKYKANGKPKQKQRIRFKDRTTGNYQVQVSAVYRSTSIRGNDKNSTAQSKASNNKDGEDENSSSWTPPENFITITDPTTVGELSGAIKACLNANNYPDTKVLLSINKDLHCSNYNLQDSDIDQLQLLSNIRAIDISNNPDITDISGLANLIYLSHLRLSDNPNISIPDFSGLTALRNLYMENMGLTAVPSLSSNDNLRVLDMSGNQIISGFENLPSNLTVIELDNNQNSNTCLDLVVSGNEYEIVNISANNNDLSDCVGVSGIKYLNVIGGNFPIIGGLGREVNQDVGDFVNGLCGLSLVSTNIELLNGGMALQHLNLQNNASLKKVEPVIFRLSNGNTRRPNFINISEDDNKLLCSNKFGIQNMNVQAVFGDEIPVGCPVIFAPEVINIPPYCSPDPVQNIEAFNDEESSKRTLTWMDHPDAASIWGVEYYKIFGTLNGENISYNTVGVDEAKIFHFNTSIPDRYEIIACTNFKCGYPKVITQPSFQAGISTVTDALATYTDTTPEAKKFTLNFNYSSTATIANAKPIRFEFSSDMDATFLQTYDCTGQCNNGNFTSAVIDYYSGLGSELKIRACNDILGCGGATSVNITPVLISADMPVPNWTIAGHNPFVPIILKWNFADETTEKQADDVDYFEITEWKPVGVESGVYLHNLSGLFRSETRFYIENDKNLEVTTERSVRLNRAVKGYYDYNIRACKRDRNNIDICSYFAGGVYETIYVAPGQTVQHIKNCRPQGTIPNWRVENCDYGHPDTYDFFIQHRALALSTVIESPNWYVDDDGKYHVSWESNSNINNAKIDYFYLRQRSTVGNAQNHCNLGVNKLNLKLKINFADLKNITNNKKIWDTIEYCQDLGQDTKWSIQACRLGHGCSDEVIVDLANQPGANSQWDPSLSSSILGEPALGGPSDFLPGMWWNPALSGTGWHFYWASELRYESTHENYGNTYDLIGYWFAYRQDKSRGVWSPTWFETRLKSLDEIPEGLIDGHTGCFEGDILSNSGSNNNPANQINVGNLQVCFKGTENQPDNQHATLIFDINKTGDILSQGSDVDNLGPYTSLSDGRLKLDIQDFAIGIIGDSGSISNPNDADHYSGLWQNSSEVQPYAGVSLLTWLERGLEVSTLAIYDDEGEPIWYQAANCGGTPISCTPSGAGYFDGFAKGPKPGQSENHTQTLLGLAYGFNPIAAKPINFKFTNVIEQGGAFYYGKIGRCLNTAANSPPNGSLDAMRFRHANIWYEINHTMYSEEALIADRPVSSSLSSHDCAVNKLTKTASLHDIRFTIQDQSENADPLVCDPNDPSEANYCNIKFQWFTDDDFPDIKAYYSEGGDAYEPLVGSPICGDPLPDSSVYVVPEYLCNFTDHPGNYTFQLRKPKYDNSGYNEVIAESKQLTVQACVGECISPIDPDPTISLVGNGLFEPILTNHITHEPGAGPIPGSGGVSGGAATYNLPLAIPPGRNGMTPSVSVNYSSKGGNGTLGLGWSISTGSSIYRCPQTLAQDDNNHAVDFTNEDRLCLDGQRLMLKTSAYLADGSTYSTEQDSFAQITKQSDSVFKVRTKSGRINTYEQQGGQNTTWQLIREEDTFGNNIIYKYEVHGINEWLLDEITYTGTGGSLGTRHIRLNYDDRIKAYSTKYLFNEKTESTQRLEYITITTPAGLHRTYDFKYVDDNAEGLLLLEKVLETAGNNTVPRTLIETTWQGDQLYRMIRPDVDGIDMIEPLTVTPEMLESISENESFASENPNGTEGEALTIARLDIGADINGDGSKELIANGDTLLFYKTSGQLKGYLGLTGRNLSLINGKAHADYNNDGITDLILYPKEGAIADDGTITVASYYQIGLWKGTAFVAGTTNADNLFDFYSTGVPKFDVTENGMSANSDMRTADFNNDGLADLLYTRLENDGACGSSDQICFYNIYFRYNLGIDTNDCITDGSSDICRYKPRFGSEIEITTLFFNHFRSSLSPTFVVKDFNQDGFADIVINDDKGGLALVYFYNLANNLENFTEKTAQDLGLTEENINHSLFTYSLYTDLNADGLEDQIYIGNNGDNAPHPGQWRYRLNTGKFDNTGKLFANDTPLNINGVAIACKDNRCTPRDAAANLFLSDINSDGINDLLIPDANNILIDVCYEASVTPSGGSWDFWNQERKVLKLRCVLNHVKQMNKQE